MFTLRRSVESLFVSLFPNFIHVNLGTAFKGQGYEIHLCFVRSFSYFYIDMTEIGRVVLSWTVEIDECALFLIADFFLWIIELDMRVTTFHFVDVISLLRYFEIFQFSLSLLALWPSVSRCGGNALYQTRVNAGNASINYHDDHHCMQQATSKRKGLDALNRVPITFISFDCSALFSLQAFCSQSFDHIYHHSSLWML